MAQNVTVERLRELLNYDLETGVFVWRTKRNGHVSAGRVAGYINGNGYCLIMVDRKFYKAARLAWLYVKGRWPADQIDHINRNRSDDRFGNLREATRSQNKANSLKYRNNTSGYKGVSRKRNKWQADIGVSGKTVHLGCFSDPEIASHVYQKAALHFFGEFTPKCERGED